MPENVKLHPHENCNCDRDGVALPPEIVLEVKNLTKKFQVDGGKVLTACDKVNLNAYKGQTLGIIGESGCGKSTLARVLLRLLPTDSGRIIFQTSGRDSAVSETAETLSPASTVHIAAS